MREHGIYARHKRRYKVTTDARHGLPVEQNRQERNFTPTESWFNSFKNERVRKHALRYPHRYEGGQL